MPVAGESGLVVLGEVIVAVEECDFIFTSSVVGGDAISPAVSGE